MGDLMSVLFLATFSVSLALVLIIVLLFILLDWSGILNFLVPCQNLWGKI